MKRRPMKLKASKRYFSRTAKKMHPKNSVAAPMRGGIRL